ncbi:hypothetical protein NQZ68_004733 [Dissostichus eleginoides]|nr:hypothetical protein NQZ68_004733 [Dissostichus eleginoides]
MGRSWCCRTAHRWLRHGQRVGRTAFVGRALYRHHPAILSVLSEQARSRPRADVFLIQSGADIYSPKSRACSRVASLL